MELQHTKDIDQKVNCTLLREVEEQTELTSLQLDNICLVPINKVVIFPPFIMSSVHRDSHV